MDVLTFLVKCSDFAFFTLFLKIFVIFHSETLKRAIYESKKKKNAYASDRWKHKAVKICFVVLEASEWHTYDYSRYAGGNEIICVISNTINISSRSIEEIVHLLRIGKVEVSRWKETKDIFNHIDEIGFSVDYFKKEHILTLGKLIPIPDHKDPVDHAIMAHAITNKVTLVSSDEKMRFYGDQGLRFVWNRV